MVAYSQVTVPTCIDLLLKQGFPDATSTRRSTSFSDPEAPTVTRLSGWLSALDCPSMILRDVDGTAYRYQAYYEGEKPGQHGQYQSATVGQVVNPLVHPQVLEGDEAG